jgi:hypothetical protein
MSKLHSAPLLVLAGLILYLGWVVPWLSWALGRLAIIGLSMAVGLWFGAYFEKRKTQPAYDLGQHWQWFRKWLKDII